jgi:hypothetical protein
VSESCVLYTGQICIDAGLLRQLGYCASDAWFRTGGEEELPRSDIVLRACSRSAEDS